MTQFLSLVLGNSSPLGLSGGATSSAKPDVAFADLLSATRTPNAANLPFSAGLRTGSTPMPEVGEPLARPQLPPAPLGTGVPLVKAVLSRDPGTPPPPMPCYPDPKVPADAPVALPQGLSPALDDGGGPPPEAGLLPVESEDPAEGLLPATMALTMIAGGAEPQPAVAPMLAPETASEPVPMAQTLLSGTAAIAVASSATGPIGTAPSEMAALAPEQPSPGTAVPAPQPEAMPEASDPEAPSPERAPLELVSPETTGGERGEAASRPAVAYVPTSADTQPAQPAQPDEIASPAQPGNQPAALAAIKGVQDPVSEPIARPAEKAAPGVGSGAPVPTVPVPPAVAEPDEPQPSEPSPGDEQPSQVTRDANRPSAEAVALRPAMANAPEAGRTTEFAQVLQAAGGESAAASAGGGAGTAELPQQMRADPARPLAEPVRPMAPVPETVSARPGEIGRQMGVEIARHSLDGRDSLTIRLDPVEMGEIQVRLQFDDRGTMRAQVTAESPVALEMLRRDSADLVRALGDAGVRTDAQSFQFESRSHSRGDQQGQHGQHGQQGRPDTPGRQDAGAAEAENSDHTPRARLRSSGSLDLIA